MRQFEKNNDQVIVMVVIKANLVANKTNWVLETSDSSHFCANKELFYDFEECTDGECICMGKSNAVGVMSKGLFYQLN